MRRKAGVAADPARAKALTNRFFMSLREFQVEVIFLMFILTVVFLGTFGTLLTVPILVLIIICSSILLPTFLGSFWTPTPETSINVVAKETVARKAKNFYDLGSGDGRLVIAVAKQTSASVTGVEIDPLKCLLSSVKIKMNRIKNARTLRQNLFRANLSKADVIFCYMPTPTLRKLEPKMKKLKKGTIIMTYFTKFPNLKIIKELKQHKVYIYKI